MDKPGTKERAEHILTSILLIREFIENVDEATFVTDSKIQSAVQYQFLVIGEAIRHLDGAILERYDYPWHIPRSFRNFIIHEYHGVKMERVFYAAQNLDALEMNIRLILGEEIG
ncbi:HepT-like ribonuclease domain-containing protein [Dyadobacter sp. 32]|uniref:HepT-like ribonuclease domain-containing protein n=1 Tax=Dyadobacter sp. 32 TaxID=538966 RepID=UPI0011EE56DA